MSSEISGTKMAIELRNISSNRTEAQEQRKVATTADKTAAPKAALGSQPASGDTVVLSDKAQSVQSLITSISEPPAVNSERIEALRTAINSGTYSVSAENIATKLLTIDFGNRNQEE